MAQAPTGFSQGRSAPMGLTQDKQAPVGPSGTCLAPHLGGFSKPRHLAVVLYSARILMN